MNLEGIILSEISQKWKDKCSIVLYRVNLYVESKNKTNLIFTETENKKVDARGWKEGKVRVM